MEGLSQEYRKTKELEIKYQNTNGRRILNLIPRGVQICTPLKLRTPDGKVIQILYLVAKTKRTAFSCGS